MTQKHIPVARESGYRTAEILWSGGNDSNSCGEMVGRHKSERTANAIVACWGQKTRGSIFECVLRDLAPRPTRHTGELNISVCVPPCLLSRPIK